MNENKNNVLWAFIASVVFVVMNAAATANGNLLLNLIPVFLAGVILAFYRLDIFFYCIVFFVPLSVPLSYFQKDLGFDVSIPTEPLLVFVLLLMILKFLKDQDFSYEIMTHPVSLAIYGYLAWILITSITSTLPLVSFKFLLSRSWFLATFYFLAAHMFFKKERIIAFWWAYIIPFIIVIFYTLWNHIQLDMTQMMAHFVMKPFYNDHTSYGAILAMFLPVLVGLAVYYYKKGTALINLTIGILIILFLVALVFSYSRAAWLSIIAAAASFVILYYRIKPWILLIAGIVVMYMFFSYQSDIMIKLEKNKQDSSTDLAEHVQSISNIATDASNVERLNRWSSALRMFQDKPFFGFGPGTYQFKYAPYQRSYEKSSISTNFGTRGNAHSEYIGPLAETGFVGTITFLIVIIITVLTGIRVFNRANDWLIRILSVSALLGLITYYIHGLMNNFLDTDKASAPFWGFTAILVALDITLRQNNLESTK